MLHAAVQYAKGLFPEVTTLAIQDSSGYKDRVTYAHVELANLSMLLYGKTWYQRMLQPLRLKPEHKEDHEYVKTLRSLMDNAHYKDTRFSRHPLLVKDKDYIHSSSWKEYFENKDPQAPSRFIRNVLQMPSLQGMEWSASIKNIPSSWPDIRIKRIPKHEQKFAVQWGGKVNLGIGVNPYEQWGEP